MILPLAFQSQIVNSCHGSRHEWGIYLVTSPSMAWQDACSLTLILILIFTIAGRREGGEERGGGERERERERENHLFNQSKLFQGSSEMLQCPRCQATVPAHPGVCGTCGENVYQCHKCRAINYDEKDPFLCNACGFSKYAKFDIFMEGKSCSAVDPIESEEDRLKVYLHI